jgi:hypothetical protein
VVRRRLALVACLTPAGLLALSLAACGDILGLRDLQLYPAEGGTDSGEDSSPDGTSGGDTGTPAGDAEGPDARDAGGTTDGGLEGDGPATTDASATDSSSADSPVADAPEDTHPVDAPFDAQVDSSTGPDSSCTAGSQTDPHNCGSCGHDCLLGACQAGVCQAFTIGSSVTAYDMIVSNGTLYWVDEQSTVWTCAIKNNACSAQTFAAGQSTPERITLGGSGNGTVYWSNYGSGSGSDGTIVSLPLAGGTPSTLASGLWTPQGIAADGTYVFWAESYAPIPQIVRRPVGSATTTSLPTGASSAPTAVAVGAGTIYWSDAVAGTGGSVDTSPEGSLSVTSLQGGQASPWDIAVDATYLYWVDYANPGTVWQYTINGGGQKQQLGTGDIKPVRIASDAANAYWIDEGTPSGFNGKLAEWNVVAKTATDRATTLDQPTALAIDSNAVYFATLGDGQLHMMVR